MKLEARLGGWSRLWIVVTILWAAVVIAATVSLGALPQRSDFMLGSTITIEADQAIEDRADAMASVPIEDRRDDAPNVFDKFDTDTTAAFDDAGYADAVRAFWLGWLGLLLIPPAVIAGIMLATRWVWRGFARS